MIGAALPSWNRINSRRRHPLVDIRAVRLTSKFLPVRQLPHSGPLSRRARARWRAEGRSQARRGARLSQPCGGGGSAGGARGGNARAEGADEANAPGQPVAVCGQVSVATRPGQAAVRDAACARGRAACGAFSPSSTAARPRMPLRPSTTVTCTCRRHKLSLYGRGRPGALVIKTFAFSPGGWCRDGLAFKIATRRHDDVSGARGAPRPCAARGARRIRCCE